MLRPARDHDCGSLQRRGKARGRLGGVRKSRERRLRRRRWRWRCSRAAPSSAAAAAAVAVASRAVACEEVHFSSRLSASGAGLMKPLSTSAGNDSVAGKTGEKRVKSCASFRGFFSFSPRLVRTSNIDGHRSILLEVADSFSPVLFLNSTELGITHIKV